MKQISFNKQYIKLIKKDSWERMLAEVDMTLTFMYTLEQVPISVEKSQL